MQRGKIFTAVAWGLGGLFLCAAAAVGFATQGFGLAELPDPPAGGLGPGLHHHLGHGGGPGAGAGHLLVPRAGGAAGGGGPVRHRDGGGQQELPEEDRLELTSSGGVLRIKWNSQLLALDLLEHNSKALIVEVPRETAEDLEELRCQAVSGL